MALMFKRNSISSAGGGYPAASKTAVGFGAKRPPELSENEKILASRSETQIIKLGERKRQQEFKNKVEAARKIQRAWRRYKSLNGNASSYKRSKSARTEETHTPEYVKVSTEFASLSKESIQRKRLKSTQAEWERQIAALTIQLAWRKFIRKKLLRSLHPNRRQLLMWDPEIVALKQHALVNYIYNEHIQAPFWHPTLKAPNRPLWFRFLPSAAAQSYNFAVDQYVPWVARLGAQPPHPELEPQPLAPMKREGTTVNKEQPLEVKHAGAESPTRSKQNSTRSHGNKSASQPATGRKNVASGSQRSSRFSYNMRIKS